MHLSPQICPCSKPFPTRFPSVLTLPTLVCLVWIIKRAAAVLSKTSKRTGLNWGVEVGEEETFLAKWGAKGLRCNFSYCSQVFILTPRWSLSGIGIFSLALALWTLQCSRINDMPGSGSHIRGENEQDEVWSNLPELERDFPADAHGHDGGAAQLLQVHSKWNNWSKMFFTWSFNNWLLSTTSPGTRQAARRWVCGATRPPGDLCTV